MTNDDPLRDLLRHAGVALFSVGVRLDVALRIEALLGERLPRPQGPATKAEAEDRRREGMARVAEALRTAGRPMNAKELAAACWPNRSPAQVRGYLSHYMNRGWLDHGEPPPGSGQGSGYVLGDVRGWQAKGDEAAQLRAQILDMERRLAELAARAAGGAR